MNFTLVVCTYMRPKPLTDLLESVNNQTRYPNEILIVDGSTNEDTKALFSSNSIKNLTYYLVDANHRGLTKQRNFGIEKVAKSSEVVCFLDDDTYLAPDYFEQLMQTYSDYPEALGVGGYISNESQWEPVSHDYTPSFHEFYYDGYKIQDSSRFILRKRLGLDSNVPPGFSPRYSHGRSIGFLPPSGKTYKVEQLMGGVASYKMKVFANFKFSTFFVGYSLYEDADFSLRVSQTGPLYINTAAQLAHYHDYSGRPNAFLYGKMVVRNGWYVWRVKWNSPTWNDRLKWNSITILLTLIRFSNTFTTPHRKKAFLEACGRTFSWFVLLLKKPKIE
ncbi:MAG: glycosyltransferase family 2 protein [Flavobacterium psychrophilum]